MMPATVSVVVACPHTLRETQFHREQPTLDVLWPMATLAGLHPGICLWCGWL